MNRKDRMHRLPWKHVTDGRKMSAVVDADGLTVMGSLKIKQDNSARKRQTHAYIVKWANKGWVSE